MPYRVSMAAVHVASSSTHVLRSAYLQLSDAAVSNPDEVPMVEQSHRSGRSSPSVMVGKHCRCRTAAKSAVSELVSAWK